MAVERIFGQSPISHEEHWISISDLMAGLMVIFLFIAITYIRPLVEVQSNVRAIVVAWNDTEVQIHAALKEEFQHDLEKWDAELNERNLSIRFNAPDVLFDSGTDKLQTKFKLILSDFFPRYLDVLYAFRDSISEIRIEGHTSSEWEGAVTEDEAYFRNMALSQARTRSVLKYAFGLTLVDPLKNWALAQLTANGLSSSRLIFDGSKENRARSRRVEFRVRTNAKEQIVRVLETIQ